MMIADTGFVVAAFNEGDPKHKACIAIYQSYRGIIYLPQTTLTEVAYLLNGVRGSRYVASFLRRLPETKYRVVTVQQDDLLRTAEILEQYADTRIDFVDATIMAVAERMNITRIFTIDRRDFSIVRPRHADYFELLP